MVVFSDDKKNKELTTTSWHFLGAICIGFFLVVVYSSVRLNNNSKKYLSCGIWNSFYEDKAPCYVSYLFLFAAFAFSLSCSLFSVLLSFIMGTDLSFTRIFQNLALVPPSIQPCIINFHIGDNLKNICHIEFAKMDHNFFSYIMLIQPWIINSKYKPAL